MVEVTGHVGDAELFDVAGLTRVVEATYGTPALGGHGWHLHIHALVFSASPLQLALLRDLPEWVGEKKDRDWLARNAFAARIHRRWASGLANSGSRTAGAVVVDIREISDDGADYVGWYLAKSTYEAATKLGMEVGAGDISKDARVQRNRTPFEVLADLSASVDARGFGVRTPRHWYVKEAGDGDWAVIDADTGEVVAVTPPGEWAVWHEWEQASRGRRQVIWSRRRPEEEWERERLWNTLLDVRGGTAQQTDEAVAASDIGGEVVG